MAFIVAGLKMNSCFNAFSPHPLVSSPFLPHCDYFESSWVCGDPNVTSALTVRGICIITALHCCPQGSQVLREGGECQLTQKSNYGSLGKQQQVLDPQEGSNSGWSVEVGLGFGSESSLVDLGFAPFLHLG